MSYIAENVINAATERFGDVVEFKQSRDNLREFHLLILRDAPTFDDRPYMTIRAGVNEQQEVSFYWGHYDLTLDKAQQNIKAA